MTKTITRYVNFQTLLTRSPYAEIVVKLMMACNDLSLVNQALGDWKAEQPNNRKPRQVGAGMYFVRIELSHLYEGFKIIEEIRNNAVLYALVCQCDQQTQLSFKELEQFLPKGKNRAEFESLIGKIRHNLAFHYNQTGKCIKKAISDRAARVEARISSMTRGDTAHLCHFKMADDIVDSIVVRQIWGISPDADVRAEVDKIADRVHQILLWFVDFSGEFIWRYCGTSR